MLACTQAADSGLRNTRHAGHLGISEPLTAQEDKHVFDRVHAQW